MIYNSPLRTALRGILQSIGTRHVHRHGRVRYLRIRTGQEKDGKKEEGADRQSKGLIRRHIVARRNDADEAPKHILPAPHLNDRGDKLVRYWKSPPKSVTKRRWAPEPQTADANAASVFEQVVEQGRKNVRSFAAHSTSAETRVWRIARAKENDWRTALLFLKAQPIPAHPVPATPADEQDIEWLVDDITYAPLPESTTPPLRGRIRHADRTADARLRLRPENLTPLTFSAYVSVLTQPAPVLHVELQEKQDFVVAISDELDTLFHNVGIGELITTEALEHCVVFLLREGNFSLLWNIFRHLQAHDYSFAPSTLDRVLEATAKEPSSSKFNYVLRLLSAPGNRTWALLHRLACRVDPKSSHEVVEALREKLGTDFGADVELVREITLHRVALDFKAHTGTVQDFLTSYASRYGPEQNWLTTSFGNRIISLVLEQSRSAETWGVVQRLSEAEASTLNIFLQWLLSTPAKSVEDHHANLTTALSYLPHFPQDKLTYSRLFALANRARAYNTARALWRVGCVMGLLSPGVQARVWASVKMKPGQGRSMWEVCMGKFVVGVGEGVDWSAFRPFHQLASHDDAMRQRENSNATDARLSETQQLLARSAREDDRDVVGESDVEAELRRIFEADVLTAGGGLSTKMKSEDLFEKAWQLDREWKGTGEGRLGQGNYGSLFGEMLGRGLRVEMEAMWASTD